MLVKNIPFKQIAWLALLAFVLNSCGIYKSRKREFQQTGSIEPMNIPAGMDSAPLEPLYSIPEIMQREDAFEMGRSNDNLRPEPMSQEAKIAMVKIQTVGGRRWIMLDAPTSQVWPLVQSFLLTNNMGVVNAKPSMGLIETDWLIFKDDEDTYHRYRLMIEKGVRTDTTEVHVLQDMQPKGEIAKEKPWPEKSSAEDREKWMVEQLSQNLARDIGNRAASLLGQAVGGEDKVKLSYSSGEPTLTIRLDRKRAQASLSHALNKEGFVSRDNRSREGIYYIAYTDPKKKSSWFGGWTKKNAGSKAVADAKLDEVLANMSVADEVAPLFAQFEGFSTGSDLKAGGYLLVMQRIEEEEVLRIRSPRGELLEVEDAKKLLMAIKRNLI